MEDGRWKMEDGDGRRKMEGKSRFARPSPISHLPSHLLSPVCHLPSPIFAASITTANAPKIGAAVSKVSKCSGKRSISAPEIIFNYFEGYPADVQPPLVALNEK